MSTPKKEITEAEILASLLKRSGRMEMNTASVQRSHRFPLHLFLQIENMAKMANLSVSTIINQLIEAGIEAVSENLTDDELKQIRFVTEEQISRPLKTLKVNTDKE